MSFGYLRRILSSIKSAVNHTKPLYNYYVFKPTFISHCSAFILERSSTTVERERGRTGHGKNGAAIRAAIRETQQ